VDAVSGMMAGIAGGAGGLAFAVFVFSVYLASRLLCGRRKAVKDPYDRDGIILKGSRFRRAGDCRVV